MSPYQQLKSQDLEENKKIIESVLGLVKTEIPSFADVSVTTTEDIDNGGFFYELDTEHNIMVNSEIRIGGFILVNSHKRTIDYLNKTFGVNLTCDIKTCLTFMALHEAGHYFDNKNQKDLMAYDKSSQAEYDKINALIIKDFSKATSAYRQVSREYQADKFAIDFMLKHFPELC